MILKEDLNYNIDDTVLVENTLYDVIGHVKCNRCPYDILSTCYGKPIFKNRKTYTESAVCPIISNNFKFKKLYRVITLTNIKW